MSPMPVGAPRPHVLLTSGRSPIALDLARQFHRSGVDVYVADSMYNHVCRYSNAVRGCFTVASPRHQTARFVEDVHRIVDTHHIDLVVPIYEEGLHLAEHANLGARLFAPGFATLHRLHNKWLFTELQRACGMVPPLTHLLTSSADLAGLDRSMTYALKPCYSRASLNMHKLLPGQALPNLAISPQSPWVAQQWITGKRFCTYSVCHAGTVRAHVTYPVRFTIDGHSCAHFSSMAHPATQTWVEKLARECNITGQVAFDFIQDDTGQLFAIECNPRPTSGVHLFSQHGNLAEAFFGNRAGAPYTPPPTQRQLLAGMLMYAWRNELDRPAHFMAYLGALVNTPDVVFTPSDVVPFCMQGLIFCELLRLRARHQLPLPAAFIADFQWDYLDQEKVSAAPACLSGASAVLDATAGEPFVT